MSGAGGSPAVSPSGRTVDRLVQFSDGVFTVALTLLVVDLGVPDLAPGVTEADLQRALQAQIPNVLAFLLTFWVVALYWLTHHRHFRLIHRYDGRLLLLNLVFLMTIVFIPWPTAVLGHYGNYVTAWVLYAGAMAAIGAAATTLWWYGSGPHGLADGVTPGLRRYYAARSLVQPAIFVLSIPVAIVSLSVAESCFVPMFLGLALVNRTYGRHVTAEA
ncbi:MAG TPA: TMEM175 family protein [Candidatus Sulfotelmatobacter sp.]|nr:TMEM175 family protein [Candidatus Sulfotelmatobacter sp.]